MDITSEVLDTSTYVNDLPSVAAWKFLLASNVTTVDVLQALSMLLNATPYAFVIDLACLASRREYLKLDKWLTDKIREHGVW